MIEDLNFNNKQQVKGSGKVYQKIKNSHRLRRNSNKQKWGWGWVRSIAKHDRKT